MEEQTKERAPLATAEAKYRDLLKRLGCNGHDGAVAEIEALRKDAGLSDLREHTASPDCWCKTELDEESQAWVHHSMDRREEYEAGRKAH